MFRNKHIYLHIFLSIHPQKPVSTSQSSTAVLWFMFGNGFNWVEVPCLGFKCLGRLNSPGTWFDFIMKRGRQSSPHFIPNTSKLWQLLWIFLVQRQEIGLNLAEDYPAWDVIKHLWGFNWPSKIWVSFWNCFTRMMNCYL